MAEDFNPYRTPAASVEPTHHTGLEHPRAMPAAAGWDWIKRGFEHFAQAPGPWIGAVILSFVIQFALSLVPFVSIFLQIIAPIFAGGLMLGCLEQDRGGKFEVTHLFEGFRSHLGPLVILGLLYFAATIVLFLVAAVVMGLFIGAGVFFGDAMSDPNAINPEQFLPVMAVVLLLTMALLVPVMMAYWFAPALIVLRNVSPVKALGLSFRACLRNIVPFLVYGVIGLLLAVLAAIPLFLGYLVLIPTFIASIYTSYKDVFPPDPAHA